MKKLLIAVSVAVCIQFPVAAQDKGYGYPDATLGESITDFLLLEKFAATKASPESAKLVHDVAKELGMGKAGERLRVLQMNRSTEKMVGRANAFIPGFGNAVVINDRWMNELTEEQKRALIGHELIHVKNHHIARKNLCLFGSNLVFVAALLAMQKFCSDNEKLNTMLNNQRFIRSLQYASMIILRSWYSRRLEREADITSAEKLKCAAGSRDLMKVMKDEHLDPSSRFVIKRFLSAIGKFLGKPLMSHPDLDDRIKYLGDLAKKQETESLAITPA